MLYKQRPTFIKYVQILSWILFKRSRNADEWWNYHDKTVLQMENETYDDYRRTLIVHLYVYTKDQKRLEEPLLMCRWNQRIDMDS